MKRIIIIGCGFAGLWAAIGAARKRHEMKKENEVEILVINKNEFHGIRVRYYENDLRPTRIPLHKLLDPVNVKYLVGEVTHIDPVKQQIEIMAFHKTKIITYDQLVLASGSHLYCPPIPGLQEHGFNIDTYESAEKLAKHLEALPKKPVKGRYIVVVVGGGFTGLEIACELPDRLKNIAQRSSTDTDEIQVIIVDHNEVGSTLGSNPQPLIEKTLHELGITTRTNIHVTSIQSNSVALESGETINTQTVIWAAGMRANRLTEMFPVKRDKFNRIIVDSYLRIPGVAHCFGAGDVACAMVDNTHTSVMSCQHSRPQGRIVGHNVVADLFGEPMIAYRQEQYVTILDLGPSNALYMEGWDRVVVSQGLPAKKTKYDINHQRIYPPLTENANDLFTMAAPIIQPIPDKYND